MLLHVYILQVISEDKWENISDKLVLQSLPIDHISNRSSKALSKAAERGLDEEGERLGNTWKYNMIFVNAKDAQNEWNCCKNDSAHWYKRVEAHIKFDTF